MTKGIVRRLSRTKSHRDAMLKNMVCSLLEQENIISTHAKLKEAQRRAERLITWSKHYNNSTNERSRETLKRIIQSNLIHKGNFTNLQNKLTIELAKRYKDRQGGYTRIIKLENRQSDKAPQSMLELVDTPVIINKNENLTINNDEVNYNDEINNNDNNNILKPIQKGNMRFWLLIKSTLYDELMNQDYNIITIGKLYKLLKPKLNSKILIETFKDEMLQIRYRLLMMDLENNELKKNYMSTTNKFSINIQEQNEKVDKLMNIIRNFDPIILQKKPNGWILMNERPERGKTLKVLN